MSTKKFNLMVVAHPDDETIFYGGTLLSHRRYPWKVICATDGNADGFGAQRKKDFEAACRQLKVWKCEMWDFQDRYEQRLDLNKLRTLLLGVGKPQAVFTHGILGEYGHPHHQDVCMAVHNTFQAPTPVWSVAYNSFPQKQFRLSKKAFLIKQKVLSETYFSQTKNFARWLPCTMTEGIHQVHRSEVEALYTYLCGGPLNEKSLKTYKGFTPYLENFRTALEQRAF